MKKFFRPALLLLICLFVVSMLAACEDPPEATDANGKVLASNTDKTGETGNVKTSQSEKLYAFGNEIVDQDGNSKSEYHFDQNGNIVDASGKIIIESKNVQPFTCIESVSYEQEQLSLTLLGRLVEGSTEIAAQPQKFTFEFMANPQTAMNKIVTLEVSDPAMVQIDKFDNKDYMVDDAQSSSTPNVQVVPTNESEQGTPDETTNGGAKAFKMKVDDDGKLLVKATIALTGTCEVRIRNIIDTEIDSFNIVAKGEIGTEEQLAAIESQNRGSIANASGTNASLASTSSAQSGNSNTQNMQAADGHTHNFEQKIVAPTIRTQGYTLYTCKICGYSYRSNYTPKTQHTHEYETTVIAATYTSGGYTRHTCKVCGNSYTDNETAALSCPHTQTSDENHPADCTSAGYVIHTCQLCKKQWKDGETPALGHDMVKDAENSKDATCTEDGTEATKCSRCGLVGEKKSIPKTGHSFDAGIITTEPTCTTDGIKTFTCTKCNETKTEAIGKTGHGATTESVTRAPTCSREGERSFKCNICQQVVKTEPIAKTDHTIEIINAYQATCSREGFSGDKVCTTCNTLIEAGAVIPKLQHQITTINASPASCVNAGYTGDKYCTVCEQIVEAGSVIPPNGHTWIKAEQDNPGRGIRAPRNPTCTEPGYTGDDVCSVCGEPCMPMTGAEIPPLGHLEGNATFSNGAYDWYCQRCGVLLRSVPQE
jgi:hypothetical protein